MKSKPIGKITHYYDKIGVAVVEVLSPIKIGQQVKIVYHGKEFIQTIESMQVEHEEIKTAKKGLVIGLKINQPVKEDAQIFKIK